MVNFNKTFTHDLQFGELSEKKVAEILQSDKIEVKTERDIWASTGNIAIEYECNGKPSGLTTTQATFWIHVFYNQGTFCGFEVFEVASLKKVINKMIKDEVAVKKSGGDNNKSKLILVPISRLFEYFAKVVG